MAVYATFADIEHALDGQIVAQLCGDAGVPLPGPNEVTDAALERGTATLRAYARVGDIYTDTELAALSTARDPLLIAIVVDLATEFLFQRRGSKITPAIEQRIKQAYSYLEALRDGKMLFGNVSQNATAGKPLVTAVTASNLAWYASAANSLFFPPRKGSTYP